MFAAVPEFAFRLSHAAVQAIRELRHSTRLQSANCVAAKATSTGAGGDVELLSLLW
jgi:hypothetical protein